MDRNYYLPTKPCKAFFQSAVVAAKFFKDIPKEHGAILHPDQTRNGRVRYCVFWLQY